jgi:hypothetical protein
VPCAARTRARRFIANARTAYWPSVAIKSDTAANASSIVVSIRTTEMMLASFASNVRT